MPDLNEIIKTVKTGLVKYAEENFPEYRSEILNTGSKFLEQSKSDMEQWTVSVASGQMSPKDLNWLIKAKLDSAELNLLTEKALVKIQKDKLIAGITDTLVN